MTRLTAGVLADAGAMSLEHEPVESAQVVAGSPLTGFAPLDEASIGTLGVWEMTPGAMRDTEAEEWFVVLRGDATVEFIDPPRPSIELGPGSVVRLAEGMQTVWTVRETLRKVYVSL